MCYHSGLIYPIREIKDKSFKNELKKTSILQPPV